MFLIKSSESKIVKIKKKCMSKKSSNQSDSAPPLLSSSLLVSCYFSFPSFVLELWRQWRKMATNNKQQWTRWGPTRYMHGWLPMISILLLSSIHFSIPQNNLSLCLWLIFPLWGLLGLRESIFPIIILRLILTCHGEQNWTGLIARFSWKH